MGLSMNSSVRLGVYLAPSMPIGFSSQRFWSFVSLHWGPGLHSLSRFPVVPPSLSACKDETTWSASWGLAPPCPPATALLQVFSPNCQSLPLLSDLDECFFFNSLVAGLPYSSICCQFWLFLVFKFVILLLCVKGGTVSPCLHLGQKWIQII